MTISRLLPLTALLLSSLCAAQASSTPFTGFSVMAGLGGIAGEANMSQSGHSLDTSQDIGNYTNQKNVFQGNVAAMLGVSYAYQFEQGLVLGGAITAGYNDVTFTSTVSSNGGISPGSEISLNGELKTQLKNDFAALFKPGYAFGHTLVYGLIGPRWGYIDTSFNSRFVNYGNPSSHHLFINDEDQQSGYQLGFTAGAGISHAFLTHFIAGIEYQYTAYNGDWGSLNTSGERIEPLTKFTAHAELERISTNTLMATVAYQF